ncbi:MAG: hypothetical protein ACFFCO_12910 [Promethearchaeota archaeon]
MTQKHPVILHIAEILIHGQVAQEEPQFVPANDKILHHAVSLLPVLARFHE